MILQVTFNEVGLCKDVVIDKQNDIAGSLPNSHIAGCSGSGLKLDEAPQIRIRCRLLVHYALSVVRRIVVDNENFVAIATDGLLRDPINSRREHVSTIQRRNDDTNSAHKRFLKNSVTETGTFRSDESKDDWPPGLVDFEVLSEYIGCGLSKQS